MDVNAESGKPLCGTTLPVTRFALLLQVQIQICIHTNTYLCLYKFVFVFIQTLFFIFLQIQICFYTNTNMRWGYLYKLYDSDPFLQCLNFQWTCLSCIWSLPFQLNGASDDAGSNDWLRPSRSCVARELLLMLFKLPHITNNSISVAYCSSF